MADFAQDAYGRELFEIQDRLIEAKNRFFDTDGEPERSQAEEKYKEVRDEYCIFRRPAALLLPEVCTRDPSDPSCTPDVPLRDVTADECTAYHARLDQLETLLDEARRRIDSTGSAAERAAATEEWSRLNDLRCYLSPPISMHGGQTMVCIRNPLDPSCLEYPPRTRCETAMDLANKIEGRVRENWNRRAEDRTRRTNKLRFGGRAR
jgi:hypothetical protein